MISQSAKQRQQIPEQGNTIFTSLNNWIRMIKKKEIRKETKKEVRDSSRNSKDFLSNSFKTTQLELGVRMNFLFFFCKEGKKAQITV